MFGIGQAFSSLVSVHLPLSHLGIWLPTHIVEVHLRPSEPVSSEWGLNEDHGGLRSMGVRGPWESVDHGSLRTMGV